MSNYPSLSESYWMDSEPTAPEWVCVFCDNEVFPEMGHGYCYTCKDADGVVTGEQWESVTGESYY